jgi:LmbE family N-acetylglucosaminyl deacetylase
MTPGPITLVGIWAHPDDETYLSAVLMRRVVEAGGRVVVITATAGERGVPAAADGSHPSRSDELSRALDAVGVHEVLMGGIPDGSCSQEDPGERAAEVAALLDEIQPDAVVTFGPDGITGHPDHVAVSAWTLAACRQRTVDVHLAAMSTAFHTTNRDLHERIGLSMTEAPLVTVDDHLIAERITPTADEYDAKLRAFAAHHSQTWPLRELMGDDVFESWWIEETFRRPTTADFDWAHELTSGRVTT